MRIASTATLVFLAACAGTGQIDVGVTASSQLAQETTTTEPEAAPRLMVTVERVDVQIGDETAEDGGWVTVFTGPTEVDLRDAASAEVFLGGAEVPVGRVTQVRLILADDAVLVTGEDEQIVSCPSCQETGIKIVTRGQLAVAEGETLSLQVVFDTAASLTASLDGLRLSPVIRLEKADEPDAP